MKTHNAIDETAFNDLTNSYDKIKFLLEYAHLAPSTHNTQPWLFRIGENDCEIYYNPKLRLPEGDPTGRDLYISLGCCIENLIIAAKFFQVFAGAEYFDGTQGERVANITFRGLAGAGLSSPDHASLLHAIPKRFNARGLFKSQPVSPQVLAKLTALNAEYGPEVKLHLVTRPADIKALGELTAEGLRRAYHRPAFRAEIAGWIRYNASSERDGIPGSSLRMNTPLSFVMPWLMRNVDIGSKLAKLNVMSLSSAPLICVYTAAANTPLQFLNVGRLAERVMLEANVADMKTSIFVASIEIDTLYQDVQNIIKTTDIPQFLMCVGYINTPQGNTPRVPLESRLV
jgi:hypothetical protein